MEMVIDQEGRPTRVKVRQPEAKRNMNVYEEQWEQFVADNMKEREWELIPRNNPYSKKTIMGCNGIGDR